MSKAYEPGHQSVNLDLRGWISLTDLQGNIRHINLAHLSQVINMGSCVQVVVAGAGAYDRFTCSKESSAMLLDLVAVIGPQPLSCSA